MTPRPVACLVLFLFALAACGDGADERRAAAAGTYRLDKDAMRGPWLTAYDKMVDGRLATLPTEALRRKESEVAKAAKAKFREQFETLDVVLELAAEGAWTLSGRSLEGPIQRSGTWGRAGDLLTLLQREPLPGDGTDTTLARYADGVIRMRPERGLPEVMVFRRE